MPSIRAAADSTEGLYGTTFSRQDNQGAAALYTAWRRTYVPRRIQPRTIIRKSGMRAETEALVDEIKQAIDLLRRHL